MTDSRRAVRVGVSVAVLGAVASPRAQSPPPSPPAPLVRQQAYLTASSADAGDHFGNGGTLEGDSVAISGDGNTLAVGAPHEAGAARGIYDWARPSVKTGPIDTVNIPPPPGGR